MVRNVSEVFHTNLVILLWQIFSELFIVFHICSLMITLIPFLFYFDNTTKLLGYNYNVAKFKFQTCATDKIPICFTTQILLVTSCNTA